MAKPIEDGSSGKISPASSNNIPAKNCGTSERILDAATALLIAEGYHSLSMRKLGSLVGLSQAAIYRHFKDKSDLVGAIVAGGYSRLKANLDAAIVPGARAAESLASGIRAYTTFALQNPSLFKAVMLQDLGQNRDGVDGFKSGLIRTRETFVRMAGLIKQGMQEGEFRPCDIETTVQAIWAAMFGMAARLAIEAEECNTTSLRQELIERQIVILVAGLRAC